MKTIALYAALLITVITLTACAQPADFNRVNPETYHNAREVFGFKPICLEGVEYWTYYGDGRMTTAVRIDSDTLMPRRCQDPQ